MSRSLRAKSAGGLSLAVCLTAVSSTGCFDPTRKGPAKDAPGKTAEVGGRVFDVAEKRGLTPDDQLAASKTFVPTGAHDEHLVLLTTGSSGRLAILGLPSMRILKYVGVFTPEPWQGFGYDDESMDLLRASAREDVTYNYGDSGLPALSETKGRYDGRALFVADGANGRIATVHLDDFETKQILTNPVFRTSGTDLAVDPETHFVLQTTRFPEIPGGDFADTETAARPLLRGGLTFWAFEDGHGEHIGRIAPADSFTVALPPYLQSQTDAGKAVSKGLVFVLADCARPRDAFAGLEACPQGAPGVLHVVDTLRARAALTTAARTFDGHPFIDLDEAVRARALVQYELPPAPRRVGVSPDGRHAVVTHARGDAITVVNLERLDRPREEANTDAHGIPIFALDRLPARHIDVGGPTVDVTFESPTIAYVSVHDPGAIHRIDLTEGEITSSISLDGPGGRLSFSGGATSEPTGRYLVMMNKRVRDRLPAVGPQKPLNPVLFDVTGGELYHLYDGSVPQATDLAGLSLPVAVLETVDRYPPGTETRSNELSPYATLPGNERVEREGNRVHIFATLIRSHITPEIVEVNQGDVVTFHLTNLEQAQDQTHGFTVSTYNVHGSWEPGKVASVTFTADREGVFPYYCTEFCSALHLEMMGYLLVRPPGWTGDADENGNSSQINDDEAKKLYEKKLETIRQTEEVIQNVVAWLEQNDYESDPRAAALVLDATNQLAAIDGLRSKIDAAVGDQDYNSARLWAEQLYMYQVKAADAGLRAKKILSEANR